MSTQPGTHSLSLEQLIENASDGIFVIDRNRRYVMFSKGCERLTGFDASELVGRELCCAELVGCKDPQQRPLSGALCPAKSILEGAQDFARQRMELTCRNGSRTWVETIYTAVRDIEGHVELVLGVMREINELREREVELLEELSALRQRVARISEQHKQQYGFSNVVSNSPAMEPVLQRMRAALRNDAPILISAESGAGKETIARTIHANGLHSGGPFVALSCSATPPTLLETELFGGPSSDELSVRSGALAAATGGTLFLDDVTDLPKALQARLLKVLQDKRFVDHDGRTVPLESRIVATTMLPTSHAVSGGRLRADLYYSLSVIRIEVPPLRQRREDIPILVDAFVGRLNQSQNRRVESIAPEAWQALMAYSWPGNVRELETAIATAFAMGEGPVLRREDLSLGASGPLTLPPTGSDHDVPRLDDHLETVEREAILNALMSAGGRRSKAAQVMGISRSRLYRRMEALGIDPNATK